MWTVRFVLKAIYGGDLTGGVNGEGLAFNVTGEIDEPDIAFKLGRMESGKAAAKLRIVILESDTLLNATNSWSPGQDSIRYKIAVYVTDSENNMDFSFNESLTVEIEADGQTDASFLELTGGGEIFDFTKIGSSRVTITVSFEGLDSTVLYIEGMDLTIDNKSQSGLGKVVLKDNYPNPFDQSTSIEYFLPGSTHALLSMYNAQGKLLEILVDAQRTAGHHRFLWKAADLPAGIYFYTLSGEQFSITKRCVILR